MPCPKLFNQQHVSPEIKHSKTTCTPRKATPQQDSTLKCRSICDKTPGNHLNLLKLAAVQTCNQIKESRVQDLAELNMCGPSEVQQPGHSKTNPPVQVSIPASTLTTASVCTQHALTVPTTFSSVTSSFSFVPGLSINRDSRRVDKGECKEVNAADDTIHGASPARSLRLSRQ